MRRRGNKSKKVPNVKLHPAQQGAYAQIARVEAESWWAEDSQFGSDNQGFIDLCPRPFQGVVLCATGALDKPTLFKKAVELGALQVSAFTDRVTHLIANAPGGAKYTCALERKIPILKPTWVLEAHDIWLRGDDVDLAQTVAAHRLPIFSGVIACPSGIEDITRRTRISKLITQNDGMYMKNLERPVKVTHLLCSGNEETEKMRYADKFNSRGEAKIHLVWEEWFWDCLEFGGRFDEEKYDVRRPRPERRITPQATSPPSSSSAMPLKRDPVTLNPDSNPPQMNDDDPEEEQADINILPSVTLQLWGGLLERRGYQVTEGKVICSPSKSQNRPRPQKPPDSPTRQLGEGRSVISSFRRANSFAPVQKDTLPKVQRPLPFRRTTTSGSVFQSQRDDHPDFVSKQGEGSTSGGIRQNSAICRFFSGMKFRALGEAKCLAVRSAIEQNGGVLVSDIEDEVDFVIVRLLSGSKIFHEEPDTALRAKYRTECWLERCIYEDRICPAEDQVYFLPLKIQLPVPGAEAIHMSLSGLDQSELCGLKRLLRALGINLAASFSKRSTHLLCPSGDGLKFKKACEWGIPVINLDWLTVMATTGTIPLPGEYLVPGSMSELHQPPPPAKRDYKGKGKAVDASGTPQNHDKISPNLESGMRQNATSTLDSETRADSIESPPSKKRKPLVPERTALLPDQPKSLFGQPTDLLGSLVQNQSSSVETLLMVGSPVIQYGNLQESCTLPDSIGGSTTRRPTVPLIDTGRNQESVPSSRTPSPLKLARRSSRLSLSPAKFDHEAAKALQESIISLLGKRPSPEDEDGAPKKGKRARPRRGKAPSKQNSKGQVSNSEISIAPISAFAESSIKPFESLESLNGGLNTVQEESMRVMYEDPKQRDEMNRLMNLLNNRPDDVLPTVVPDKPETSRRRSTRIAGF